MSHAQNILLSLSFVTLSLQNIVQHLRHVSKSEAAATYGVDSCDSDIGAMTSIRTVVSVTSGNLRVAPMLMKEVTMMKSIL